MQSIKKTPEVRNANGMPAAPETQKIIHKALPNLDLNIFKINISLKEFGVRSKGMLHMPNI
jgi:hypothetical protein